MPPIWIYIPSDAQLSPSSFGIFKSVCWYGKFVFILVLSLRSEDAPCYTRPIHGKDSLAMGQFSTRAILSHTMTGNRQKFVKRVWQKYRQSKESARSESSVKFRITKLHRSKSSVILCERIARVENCPGQEHLFRESVAHNMVRLHFWPTDRKDKTKIKTNFPYQHTLLNIPNDGGLNCASDGI